VAGTPTSKKATISNLSKGVDHDNLTNLTSGDPHTQYRLESEDHTHESTGAQAGKIDHGNALNGLTDDDHTQYLLASAATDRATFATNWTDLTDGGATTLHSHSGSSFDGSLTSGTSEFVESNITTEPWEFVLPGTGIAVTIEGTSGSTIRLSTVDSEIDHGSLGGLGDDDHSLYLLASDATDRTTFASSWADLTDAGETALHSHFQDNFVEADCAAPFEQAVEQNSALSTINVVIDGGGSAITTGIKVDITIPFNCTILSNRILADQTGSIVIDIWKDTLANYPPTDADSITASAPPTLSSATNSENTTLTGWTTSINSGDTLRFNVDSITTVTRVTLALMVIR
jgi:hypothetical protein